MLLHTRSFPCHLCSYSPQPPVFLLCTPQASPHNSAALLLFQTPPSLPLVPHMPMCPYPLFSHVQRPLNSRYSISKGSTPQGLDCTRGAQCLPLQFLSVCASLLNRLLPSNNQPRYSCTAYCSVPSCSPASFPHQATSLFLSIFLPTYVAALAVSIAAQTALWLCGFFTTILSLPRPYHSLTYSHQPLTPVPETCLCAAADLGWLGLPPDSSPAPKEPSPAAVSWNCG